MSPRTARPSPVVLATLATIAVLHTVGAPPALGSPSTCSVRVLDDSRNEATLCEMGSEGFALDPAQRVHGVTARLPPGTHNRADDRTFYVFRLVATVRLAADDGAGALAVVVNGKVVSQVNVHRENGTASAFYSGYLTGPVTRPIGPDGAVSIDYENYLQFGSLAGGDNTVEFFVEDYGDSPFVVAADVQPSTALVRTTANPYQLTLRVPTAPVDVGVGRRFSVPFSVDRRGERPDGAVTIDVLSPQPDYLDVSAKPSRADRVGNEIRGEITGVARGEGRYAVRVSVAGRLNDPTGTFVIVASRDGPDGDGATVRLVALACAPLPLLAIAYLRRRRGAD